VNAGFASVREAAVRSATAGFATVWVAIAMTAVLALVGLGVRLGVAVDARHRAEAAADLGALAAAVESTEADGGCSRAAWVARRMGTRIVSCRVVGLDTTVEVEVPVGEPFGVLGTVVGRARAGPMDR
jgi:secretion/DNA translocation related TadE-like protein